MLTVVAALAVVPALFGSQTPSPAPQRQDCSVYNPETLTIERLETGVWRLEDGGHYLAGFANEAEGKNALALAQRFREMCFIGRTNRRAGNARGSYMLTYWQGSSGKSTTIEPEQCQAYDPAKLHVVDRRLHVVNQGAQSSVRGDSRAFTFGTDWVVTDDADFTLTLDSQEDAAAALALARQFKSRCTIGSYVNSPGQLRTSRFDYWK
jgi:hypothetical protein